MAAARPTEAQAADRALVLYAFVRRAFIEHVIATTDGDPTRVRQGEAAREETDRWLDRETLNESVTDVERSLFDARSGSWPAVAINDGMWRKEALGALLWALQHLAEMPAYDQEFPQSSLDDAIMRYGSVSSFRAEGTLRADDELENTWMESDAWIGATEGRDEDASIASIAAERYRALNWLRDAAAPPP